MLIILYVSFRVDLGLPSLHLLCIGHAHGHDHGEEHKEPEKKEHKHGE